MVFFVGGSAPCAAGKKDRLVLKKVALHQPVLLSDTGSLEKEIKSKNIPVNLYTKSLEVNEKNSSDLFEQYKLQRRSNVRKEVKA